MSELFHFLTQHDRYLYTREDEENWIYCFRSDSASKRIKQIEFHLYIPKRSSEPLGKKTALMLNGIIVAKAEFQPYPEWFTALYQDATQKNIKRRKMRKLLQ